MHWDMGMVVQVLKFHILGYVFRSLCMKFPRKHVVMMTFLSSMLRDDVSTMNFRKLTCYTVLTNIKQ